MSRNSIIHIESKKDLYKKHICVLYGGLSAERNVSISSGKAVIEACVNLGYNVSSIDVGFDLHDALVKVSPDIVFNALHGSYGEDGRVSAILDFLRIPYTHSGALASSISFNKVVSHNLFSSTGIKTIPILGIFNKDNYLSVGSISRPYVIKPMSQGSSVGVHLVFEGDNFDIKNYDFSLGDFIIEKYIKGREVQVAVLDGSAIGALEIELLNGKRFYDYETKYVDGFANHICPPKFSDENIERVLKIAENAYKACFCRGIVRAEFIFSEDEQEFYILEINTHPGFTPLSICPEIAAKNGIGFDSLIDHLIKLAKYDT